MTATCGGRRQKWKHVPSVGSDLGISVYEQSTSKGRKLSGSLAASPSSKTTKLPRKDLRSMASPSGLLDVTGFFDLRKNSSLAAECTSLLPTVASPPVAEGRTSTELAGNERVEVEGDAMSECSAKPEGEVRALVSEATARLRRHERGVAVVLMASSRMSKIQARPKRKRRPPAPSFRDYLPQPKAGASTSPVSKITTELCDFAVVYESFVMLLARD